jgi:hypothetical protein
VHGLQDACAAVSMPEQQEAASDSLETMESDSEMLKAAAPRLLSGVLAALACFAGVLLHM